MKREETTTIAVIKAREGGREGKRKEDGGTQ